MTRVTARGPSENLVGRSIALRGLVTQSGSDTLVTFDPDNVIILHDVTAGQLTSADFALS